MLFLFCFSFDKNFVFSSYFLKLSLLMLLEMFLNYLPNFSHVFLIRKTTCNRGESPRFSIL